MKDSIENIIYYLLNLQKPATMKELAQVFSVSEKTIWNRLRSFEVEQLLEGKIQLVKERNVGVYLVGTEADLERLKTKIIRSFGEKDFTTEIRHNSILIELLLRNVNYTIKDFADKYFVSRKIIIKDLEAINHYIGNFEVTIQKVQNQGLKVVGDELLIRQLLEKTILQMSFHFKHGLRKDAVFDEGIKLVLEKFHLTEKLTQVIKIVDEIQKEILGFFADESKKEIIIQILVSRFSSSNHHIIAEIGDDLYSMDHHYKEFKEIFNRNYLDLNENDYLYIWRRCVNNRFSAVTSEQVVNEKIMQLSVSLLDGVIDTDKNSEFLIENLAFHLIRAIERSSMGIRINNPVLAHIKEQYGKFYSLMLVKVSNIEKAYNVTLNEDEIGFITLYICALYEKQMKDKYYKVLLVSNEDIGQTQLISMQLVKDIPNLLIQNNTNSLSLSTRELEECDLILSTTPLLLHPEHRKKFIRISNFINEKDIRNISDYLFNITNSQVYAEQTMKDYDVQFEIFHSDLSTREAILNEFSNKAAALGLCDADFAASVLKREYRASTSIGRGMAIPHGNSLSVRKNAVFIIKNKRKVSWGFDEVDTVILLVIHFSEGKKDGEFLGRLYNCMEKTDLIRNAAGEESLEKIKKYIFNGELNNG